MSAQPQYGGKELVREYLGLDLGFAVQILDMPVNKPVAPTVWMSVCVHQCPW